jgi:hypothetical protein
MFRCNHHHHGAHYLSLLELKLLKQSIKYIGVVNLQAFKRLTTISYVTAANLMHN